jgi:hypothetical protein
MSWRDAIRDTGKQTKQVVQSWSLINYVFNLAVSTIPALALGHYLSLPIQLRIAVGVLTFIAISCGFILYQSGSQDRLQRVRKRIRALADEINISGLTVGPMRRIGPARDPLKEAGFELRAMVNIEICNDYLNCLEQAEPAVAAKRYLEALADTLSPEHLKGAPTSTVRPYIGSGSV